MLHTAKTFTTLKSVKITFSKEMEKKTLEIYFTASQMHGLQRKKEDKATT